MIDVIITVFVVIGFAVFIGGALVANIERFW